MQLCVNHLTELWAGVAFVQTSEATNQIMLLHSIDELHQGRKQEETSCDGKRDARPVEWVGGRNLQLNSNQEFQIC